MSLLKCPNCKSGLEVPDTLEDGQHVLCPYCNVKFFLHNGSAYLLKEINETSNEHLGSRDPDINKRNIDDNRTSTSLEMEKIRKSKDILKYLRLFSLAPTSIKIATVLILIDVLIDFIIRIATMGSSKYSVSLYEFITICILGGILKGFNRSRWVLLFWRFAAVIITVAFFFNQDSCWASHFFAGVWTVVSSIPYIVVLFLPSSNKWFSGIGVNAVKLHEAVENDMKPMSLQKRVLVAAAILGVWMLICGGAEIVRSCLLGNSDDSLVLRKDKILNQIVNDYTKSVNKNCFGEIVSDNDLLYARKDVDRTKRRIKDAKDFLQRTIIRIRHETVAGNSEAAKQLNRSIEKLCEYLQSQLDMVGQAEKMFYGCYKESKYCSLEERRKLQKKYENYDALSRTEYDKLMILNKRMFEIAKELKSFADESD